MPKIAPNSLQGLGSSKRGLQQTVSDLGFPQVAGPTIVPRMGTLVLKVMTKVVAFSLSKQG